MGATAEAAVGRPRRRPLVWRRIANGSVPYLLVAPVVLVLFAVLAYPIYYLVRISLEDFTLFTLAKGVGPYIGLKNFSSVLHDQVFWHTLLRTVVFTAVNVTLTIVGGTLIALLLKRLWTPVRILLTVGLILVWAMPPVVAVQVWIWMTNVQNGVLNYVLTTLHFGNYDGHNWFGSPISSLGMATTLIVWGALPFVVITVYAALSQVPHELVEAAQIDGAPSWRVFKDVTMPVIAPILYLLTCLSILWDFGVFTQVYLLIGQPAIVPANYVMGIYLWEQAEVLDLYGRGAAISILMLVIVAAMSIFYVRRMVRTAEIT
ncbi:MAG TPA: sugar ABC transporter permease [Gaiellaceae bacterium]|nr:sugar ABC transporter permease [Gaiellaceae bacterium]